jgi:hypothetical protein
VRNRNGNVAIPRGSDVELVVREISNNEVALDLNAITVNGQRYTLLTDSNTVTSERKEGIGVNKRTGKYVGGGAVIGAIIGGITGGKKGAAIGAGVGAGAGAGAQVLTRGDKVNVPVESLLTFRLQQPLQTSSNGVFTQTYEPNDSAAFRAGLQAGRSDADRNLPRNAVSDRWRTAQQQADYQAGYDRGYYGDSSSIYRQKPDLNTTATITIGRDNNIRWQAPEYARVYVSMDNEPRKLFAEGQSGTQSASWIQSGHLYVFSVEDSNGNEIARDRLDLRATGTRRRR